MIRVSLAKSIGKHQACLHQNTQLPYIFLLEVAPHSTLLDSEN